ncbi:N-hydroxyarylamine O-acetyltransferase [Chitinophaga niastensis]|uniref:N-hydroxyarylamine O-acetyltransferase n=1 Tax=Chitinophaga niastensis TaxID=536980 RepID=A0A2P8HVV7_CHINA|nr:arylamine N-acetyltransferase [Chitinophaga niastensis]PSL50373.1 N-hydroxyarylamine O-acetyltransferase [Chitinophaga niastensis]
MNAFTVYPNHIDSSNFELQSYLDRIHFIGDVHLNIGSISKMMQCQLFSIPFENLDVQDRKTISLVGDDIVDKIIGRKRGGYCYEVNGLFALALQKIGVPYIFVAARPLITPVENPRTHMAIIATIENEEYLIDLGFGGDGIREPLKLSSFESEEKQGSETFSLMKTADNEYLLKSLINNEWRHLYSFNLHPQRWIDFKPANYFNSTHADSFFVQNLLVVLQNPLGKKILFRGFIKSIANGKTESYSFEENEYDNILAMEFNLKRM